MIREKATTMFGEATHHNVKSTTDTLKHGNGSHCLGGRRYNTLTQTTNTMAVGYSLCPNQLIGNTHRQGGGTSTRRKHKFKNPNSGMWQLLTLDSSSNWSMGQAQIPGGTPGLTVSDSRFELESINAPILGNNRKWGNMPKQWNSTTQTVWDELYTYTHEKVCTNSAPFGTDSTKHTEPNVGITDPALIHMK